VQDPGAAPAPAKAAPPAGKPGEPADLLRRCVQAWGNAAQRAPLLAQLGEQGTAQFDLSAFAQEAFAKAFPLDAGELKALLQDKKYGAVLDAIAQRAPAAPLLASAAKNQELVAYCKSKAGDTRAMARKGLMAQLWVFPGALPKDEEVNKKFFGDLAMSGAATSPDKKSIIGVLLGGEQLKREHAEAFVKSHLSQAILMADIAAGKPPRVRELSKLVAEERATIVRDLESRYGKPEPRSEK
jgi:hypothetical protein